MTVRDNSSMKKLILGTLLMTTQVYANELSLYFIPSPKGMDWSSPSNLAKSALMNKISFKPHFMGHVWVELKCGNEHDVTGMVGKNFDYLSQLLMNNRGLGILYHSFDGRLEDKADIEKEKTEYLKNGGMNFVNFKLNEGQCKRASQYLAEYRKNDVGRYYGLANRPRFGEGAGCTAFGTSFADVLNILDQDMKESWSQSVNIPLELAGPPLKEEGVSLFKVLFNAGSWADEKVPHQKLTFWDPDRMYNSYQDEQYRLQSLEGYQQALMNQQHPYNDRYDLL
jgi:hypothetical protein